MAFLLSSNQVTATREGRLRRIVGDQVLSGSPDAYEKGFICKWLMKAPRKSGAEMGEAGEKMERSSPGKGKIGFQAKFP